VKWASAGRAAGDLFGIEHHEGQPPVTLQGMAACEGADAFFLVVGKPMIAWHPGVVFIDFAEAFLPVAELAGTDADPGEEARHGYVTLVGPGADEIDELIAGTVGHPAAL